jgi:hypothetical protein
MSGDIGVVSKIGKLSSLVAGVCTVLFGLLIILDFFVGTIMFQYIVCFLLAVSFVVVANSLHASARPEVRIWGRIAVSFSVIYAVFICFVYYSQLTVVRLGLLAGDSLRLVNFTPGSWLFAVDMLGYTFLALSTLAAVFMFRKTGLEKAIRIFLIIHTALGVPTVLFPALPLFGTADAAQSASLGGSFALLGWCVVFAPLCFLLARYFSLKAKAPAAKPI